MAEHIIEITIVMEDMDGTPEQSAEILLGDQNILMDYIEAGAYEVTGAYENDDSISAVEEVQA